MLDVSVRSSIPSASALNTSAVEGFPFTKMLLRSVITDSETDDNAQSILEEHVSRVWESSNGPTPGMMHSPGLQTPNQLGGRVSSKGHSGGQAKSSVNRTKDDLLWPEDKVRHSHRHGMLVLGKESSRELRHSRQHGLSSRVVGAVSSAIDIDTKRPATRRSLEPVHSSLSATSNVCGTMLDSLEATKER